MYVPEKPANYVSRPQEEQEIITRIIAQSQKDSQSIVVLYGIDGYGKSTLAKKVCHASDIGKIFAENIYWVELKGNENTGRIGRKELYKQLKNLSVPLNTEITYSDLKLELRDKRCLVVLDDLREEETLEEFLKAGESSFCIWLITTQKRAVSDKLKAQYGLKNIDKLLISKMRRNEAFELLGYGWSEFDRDKLQRLADRLYEFPFLITLVRNKIDERLENFSQTKTNIDLAINSVNDDLKKGIKEFVGKLDSGKSEELLIGLYKSIPNADRGYLKQLAIFHCISIPLTVVGRLWEQNLSDVRLTCERLYNFSMLAHYDWQKDIILNDILRRYFLEKEPKENIRATHEKLLRAYEALPKETVLSQEEENYLHLYLPFHWKKAGRRQNSSPVSDSPPVSNFPMHILHLSDLHFGTAENARNWHSQLAEDLGELDCPRLDALILSGDIANKSTPEEYTAAKQFLDNLCQDFQLKKEQIVVVPGNHDLNWKISEEEGYKPVLRRNYQGSMDSSYVIDDVGIYVAVLDPEQYRRRFENFSNFYKAIKGKEYPTDYDRQYTLDRINNLLILGLNSAWQLDHHYKTRASINADAIHKALTDIRRNQAYKNCLKIGVWHHPLNSAFEDRITDHGFMEQLAKADFRFALHGHIHKAETSLFKYDMSAGGRKLDIICAGTFGAPTKELVSGYPWQYNLLKFENNKLTVHTRRREELNGAWKPDARWLMGAGQNPLPYYEIQIFTE